MLLRLVSLPIEPTAGEVRSGIGGGPPIGAGRGPAGAGGGAPDSSVGLPVSDDTEDRAPPKNDVGKPVQLMAGTLNKSDFNSLPSLAGVVHYCKGPLFPLVNDDNSSLMRP
ncbi:hypothetical protein GQX74_006661 [Glossina fuscipes]|nr:hypothetical protein GQX74_006661 [Glossina fuscipes]